MITPNYDFQRTSEYSTVDWIFTHEAFKRELHIRGSIGWMTGVLPAFSDHDLASSDAHHELSYVRETMNSLVHVSWNHHNSFNAVIASSSVEELEVIKGQLEKDFPKIEVQEEIRMTFWYNHPQGPRYSDRILMAPTWKEISDNYPHEIFQSIDHVVKFDEPDAGGKMLLWQGSPGTGKTFAIRALAREWSRWCNTLYITDPEEFFGNAYYMMSILLENDDDNKWRLLIVEDAGELLSKDAKERAGQSLSRLLNLTEGMIGQGLKTLVLITTNEPLRDLNDAVMRPGRCLSHIDFQSFTASQADEWRGANGKKKTGKRATLAELYAEETGIVWQPKELVQVGFR